MPEPLAINDPPNTEIVCAVCQGPAVFFILAYPPGQTNRAYVCSAGACVFIAAGKAMSTDVHMTLNIIGESHGISE